MVLWIVSHFAHLSLRHYVMIAVTIVVPVVFPTVMGYFPLARCLLRVQPRRLRRGFFVDESLSRHARR